MSGRLRVVVATTDGPSTIRRITEEDESLRSVVCLAGTATSLPISADYDAFVRRPTGVVERDTGHRVYRVDVDRTIDEGRSWQLGFYLAHRLKQVGRLAEDDQPADGIVWATGTVDADLRIGHVARVSEKARRSAALFEVGLPVLAVAASEHAEELPSGADALPVDRMETVLAHLTLIPDQRAGPVRRYGAGFAALGCSLFALVGWAAWQGAGISETPPVAPVAAAHQAMVPSAVEPFDPKAIVLEVLEARPGSGGCGEERVVDPAKTSPPGVCAVAFRLTNRTTAPVQFWLYGAIQGGVREYASRRRNTELAVGFLAPGESGAVRVAPPDWMRRPVVVRGLLIVADGVRPQVDQALVPIDLLSSGEIDTLVAGLRELDVDVREVFHRVSAAP